MHLGKLDEFNGRRQVRMCSNRRESSCRITKAKNLFAETDADTEDRAIAEAEADVEAGRVVSHEDVVNWVRSWGTSDESPCPVPKPR